MSFQAGPTSAAPITIRLSGGHFELFVNGVDVGGLDDGSYHTGYIGLEAGAKGAVSFSQLRITAGG